MAIAHASWIHGHSMQIEYPDRVSSIRRAGYSISIIAYTPTNNWFHFAIPTPVIVNDRRLKVGSVMLCFETSSNDSFVDNVHVWDGNNRIAAHDDLGMRGVHSFERFEVPGHPEPGFGVGISIGVGFGVEGGEHRMDFISAGCDFLL